MATNRSLRRIYAHTSFVIRYAEINYSNTKSSVNATLLFVALCCLFLVFQMNTGDDIWNLTSKGNNLRVCVERRFIIHASFDSSFRDQRIEINYWYLACGILFFLFVSSTSPFIQTQTIIISIFFYFVICFLSLSFSGLSGLFLVDCKTRSDLTEEQVGITFSEESWEWHRITS